MNRLLFLLAVLLLAPLAGAQPVHLVANTGAHDAGGGGGGGGIVYPFDFAFDEGTGTAVNAGTLGNGTQGSGLAWANDGTRDVLRFPATATQADGIIRYVAGEVAYDFSAFDNTMVLIDFLPTEASSGDLFDWVDGASASPLQLRFNYDSGTPAQSSLRVTRGGEQTNSDGTYEGADVYTPLNARTRLRITIDHDLQQVLYEKLDPADDSVTTSGRAGNAGYPTTGSVFDAGSSLDIGGGFNSPTGVDFYELKIWGTND